MNRKERTDYLLRAHEHMTTGVDKKKMVRWDGDMCPTSGPVFEGRPVTPELWRHWATSAGRAEPKEDVTVYNMSADPRCIDHRWITDDAEKWGEIRTN